MVDFGALGDKAKDFVNSEKGENTTDAALKRADDAASKATHGKYDDKIDAARDAADKKIGC